MSTSFLEPHKINETGEGPMVPGSLYTCRTFTLFVYDKEFVGLNEYNVMHAKSMSTIDQCLQELKSNNAPYANVECILPTQPFLCLGAELKIKEVFNLYSIPILWKERIWWLHVRSLVFFEKLF